MSENNVERFVAENVTEAVWLRLRRLTSSELCKKIIAKQSTNLTGELIEQKSHEMSWAIQSALGYWETHSGGLNSKILSRYYAILQISIAEQLSSSNSKYDLKKIQKHTESGHGLFTLKIDDDNLPDSYLIGCLSSGHFYSYCKNIGHSLKSYIHEKKPKKPDEADTNKVYSLSELLCRVPELQAVISEYLNRTPLSFHIGSATRNMIERSEKRSSHLKRTGQMLSESELDESPEKTTYIGIYPEGYTITQDELNALNLPIKNISLEDRKVSASSVDYFVGELRHPSQDYWWEHIETYKSGYCGTSYIVPFWGTSDPFILHLVILYSFSIIVRYLPETWHSIEYGSMNHIRALLEHYLVIVDNVLPKLAVERLTHIKLDVSQPGSLTSPI